MNKYKSLLVLLSLILITPGQLIKGKGLKVVENEQIHWLSIDEALALNEKHPKKIYIDIYTSWCGWCKKMDKESFKDPKVVAEMNKDFYAVKFDAESKEEVVFNQVHYKYKPEYQANEFAVNLLNGQLAYPSGIIINEKEKVLTQLPGYQNASMLVEILSYFGNNIHLSQTWDQYTKSHKAG